MAEYDITKNLVNPESAERSLPEYAERLQRGVYYLAGAGATLAVGLAAMLYAAFRSDGGEWFVIAVFMTAIAFGLATRGIVELVLGFIRYAKDT